MQLIDNYPESGPVNSVYLPLTRRREYLSLADKLADPYLRATMEVKDNYTEKDFFEKKVAIQVIFSAIDPLKNSLRTRLSSEEQSRAFKKLDTITDLVIEGLQERPLAKEIYKKLTTIFFDWIKEVQLENPSVLQKAPFSLIEEDFRIAEGDHEKYVQNERIPACHDFAFYQLNEVKAFPFIFHEQVAEWPTKFVFNPVEFLSEWGYVLVRDPSPGDLAVYCSTLKGHLEAKHWGIWTKNQKVLSKCGIGEVLEHPIDDVIIGYGNFVYFFHKKIKSPLLLKFLDELEAASDLSHPAQYSPLSARGVAIKMMQFLENCPLENVFKNNIFNQEYNLELKNKILISIWDFSKKITPLDSKIETIQLIKQFIFSTSENVKREI